MPMPGAIRRSQQYNDMKAFRADESAMHSNGWKTQGFRLLPVRGGLWSNLIRRRRRQQVDAHFVR